MRVRPWVLPASIAVVAALVGAGIGVMEGPIGTPSFVPSQPLEDLWVRSVMPHDMAERGRTIGVAQWSQDATFMGETWWAEERSMTLGPMAEGGGFLDPGEAIDVWRFRAGWPFRWLEMSSWARGSTLVQRGVWDSDPFGVGRSGGLPGVPIGIRLVPLVGTLAAFATAAWAALVLPFELRRRRRRERGECVECGHTLAGAARCPECGAAPAHAAPTGPAFAGAEYDR